MKFTLSVVVVIVAAVILGGLAFTNPTAAQYRAHIQETEGLMGTLGLGLADLLSAGSNKGIHRESYGVCSKFYLGGDGVLPRQDLAWGIAGHFWEIEKR